MHKKNLSHCTRKLQHSLVIEGSIHHGKKLPKCRLWPPQRTEGKQFKPTSGSILIPSSFYFYICYLNKFRVYFLVFSKLLICLYAYFIANEKPQDQRMHSGDAPPSLVNRALAGLSRGDRGSSYRGSRGGRRGRGRGRGFW